MNRIKRFTAFMLIMGAMLSLCSFAQAEETASDNISVKANDRVFAENSGSLIMTVEIKNANAFPVKLAAVQPSGGSIVSAAASDATPGNDEGIIEIPANSTKAINVNAALAASGNSSGALTFLFNYENGSNTLVASSDCTDFSITRTPVATQTPEETPTADTEFRIRTSSVDPAGVAVSTPSGDYGEDLTLRL